jgi:hypothetical protein
MMINVTLINNNSNNNNTLLCTQLKHSSRRREFVDQIKIGCECFNVLTKRPIL